MTYLKFITILVFILKISTSNVFSQSITDTRYSKFPLSVFPKVSTNGSLSIITENKYSFNLFAGCSKGVSAFELGGFLNIVNGNVKYVQIAGLMNLVSGKVTGFQLAGILNLNSNQTTGLQLSGIANINKSNINGLQLSGVYNQAKNTKGVQLSGVMNISDTVNGVQISGIVNKTRYLKGVQVSFLNILDTTSGLPIGFFSYVKNGYHKLEIATDELKYTTISFGTGINKLHNIFIAGINYSKPQMWTYGYGLGGVFSIHKKWNVVINVTAQQFQNSDYDITTNNILSKLFVGVEYKIKPKIQIGFGPTFNDFTSKNNDVNYGIVLQSIPKNYFYNEDIGNKNTKIWLGAKLYFKIL